MTNSPYCLLSIIYYWTSARGLLLDLLLIMTLGFLGSFGHCLGMCGPLTVAFSLSQLRQTLPQKRGNLTFHLLLNIGRILSYGAVGAILGGVGSLVIASGQLAGIGSGLRQGMAFITGLLLIWFALVQIIPDFLPKLPIFHPIQGILHRRLGSLMTDLSLKNRWWTPAILGGFWGLIPCGFLYIAQIKAAETGDLWRGSATMLAFGLGTSPIMLGVGIFASCLSVNQRSQLYRLGGWITLIIGILTLLRTDAMIDFTGHGSLLLLMLALVARPLSNVWGKLLQYRRLIGVGAFILAVTHTAYMLEHSLNWNLTGIVYFLPQNQWGMGAGIAALLLMIPAAFTSFDSLQKALGKRWRQIHLLIIPGLILAAIHTIFLGSHYLGELIITWENQLRSMIIIMLILAVFLVRSRLFLSLFTIKK